MNDFEDSTFHGQWKKDSVMSELGELQEDKCQGYAYNNQYHRVGTTQLIHPECVDCDRKAQLKHTLNGTHIEPPPKLENNVCPNWKIKENQED